MAMLVVKPEHLVLIQDLVGLGNRILLQHLAQRLAAPVVEYLAN